MERERTQLRTEQNIELSQQTVQLLSLLPLNGDQLEERIRDAVEENPFLSLEESEEEENARFRRLSRHRVYEDEDYDAAARIKSRARDMDLHSHLALQLRLSRAEEPLKEQALRMLGYLDTHGMLVASTETLAAAFSLSAEELEAALALLQSLEPAGVGARDLAERLTLQLRREDCRDPYAYRILEDHLEDMAAGRTGRIARALGCSTEEVERSFARIRALDPDPCAAFAPAAEPVYVRPDIYARFGEGGWELRMARGLASRLRLCSYELEVEADDAAAAWIRSRQQEAAMLVNNLQLHRRTVLAITAYILDVQRQNALDRTQPLQPLRLEDVAAATGFSVSTVSRVVQGKTVAFERGSRPLRSFFSKSHHGHSVDELHRRIRELAAVSPPLDDTAMAEQLSISRRTVAKYRLELGIPPARNRK